MSNTTRRPGPLPNRRAKPRPARRSPLRRSPTVQSFAASSRGCSLAPATSTVNQKVDWQPFSFCSCISHTHTHNCGVVVVFLCKQNVSIAMNVSKSNSGPGMSLRVSTKLPLFCYSPIGTIIIMSRVSRCRQIRQAGIAAILINLYVSVWSVEIPSSRPGGTSPE